MFQTFVDLVGPFDIDLFASYLNYKMKPYVSWGPDPYATYVDAFSIPWFFNNPFAFPPYSVIHKCLQKIEVEEINRVTMLLPNWPSQPWFPIMLRLLIAHPIYIPQVLLFLPWDPLTQSSLSQGTAFLLVQLSGKSSNIMDYHRSLQNSSHVHGKVKLKRITP